MSDPEKIKIKDVAQRSAHEIEDENNSDREEKGSQALLNGDSARLVSDEAGQNGWHQQVLPSRRPPSALKTINSELRPT
jgi:hypothetical protein